MIALIGSHRRPLAYVVLLAAAHLVACTATEGTELTLVPSSPTATPASRSPKASAIESRGIDAPSATTAPPSPKPVSTDTPILAEVGPEYIEGYNPLTGLPLDNPDVLRRNPLLVSISNFPLSARPQAGLAQAAQVWETSIGQGMTRFLAVYYGDYLEALGEAEALRQVEDKYGFVIGPIRSGRIAFEEIKTIFPDSKLVIRSASSAVIARLTNVDVLDPLDPQDVNSAGLRLADVEDLVNSSADPNDYAGLTFASDPPAGGEDGASLRIVYNVFDDVGWEFDPVRGLYLRSQNRATEGGKLFPVTDRLSGEQLAAENVILLFASHRFENLAGTILEIKLAYIQKNNGFLFRDGKRYSIKWGTIDRKLRIRDAEGHLFPLKPGRTFFEVVSYQSTWDEEIRLLRFHSPPLPTLTPAPTPTPSPTSTATPTPSQMPTP